MTAQPQQTPIKEDWLRDIQESECHMRSQSYSPCSLTENAGQQTAVPNTGKDSIHKKQMPVATGVAFILRPLSKSIARLVQLINLNKNTRLQGSL